MAASDLIHEGRAQVLYLLKDGTRARHHYASGQDRVASDWHLDYLRWLGVSEDRVRFIETSGGALDSLAEARTMATELADHPEIKRLVIVTSATHTRRSLMAFKAALPPEITPVPYAANLYLASAEVHRPLWIEYVKLVVYALRLVAS